MYTVFSDVVDLKGNVNERRSDNITTSDESYIVQVQKLFMSSYTFMNANI